MPKQKKVLLYFIRFCNRGVQGGAGARVRADGEKVTVLVDVEIYLFLWIFAGMTLMLNSPKYL